MRSTTPAAGQSKAARRCRASAQSVFARIFLPFSAAASAGSAKCTSAPTRSSSSTTNRQPVVASSATSKPDAGTRPGTSGPPHAPREPPGATDLAGNRGRSTRPRSAPGAGQAPSRSTPDQPPLANHGLIEHAAADRPPGSPSPTVQHGRYLPFEWPAARLVPARAFNPCRSTWRSGHLHRAPGDTPTGTSHLS